MSAHLLMLERRARKFERARRPFWTSQSSGLAALVLVSFDRLWTRNDPCDVGVDPRRHGFTIVLSLPALLTTRVLFPLAFLALFFFVSLVE